MPAQGRAIAETARRMVVANDGDGCKAPSRPAGGFAHLKTRPEFLRAAKGSRFHTQAFSLQAAPNVTPQDTLGDTPAARFGFTVTKKTAGAVGRNRIRRRLREAARVAALSARPGYDYVLVAREEAAGAPFARLVEDLVRALDEVHRRRGGGRRRGPRDVVEPMTVRPADAAAVKALRAHDGETTPAAFEQDRLHPDPYGPDPYGKDQ